MSDSFGLSGITIEKINTVFARYPEVETVSLYGSRAKGTFKNGSDIDLAMTGASLSQDIRSRIAQELDDLLLPYEIDLSIFGELHNDELAAHIRRVGKIFYTKS